MPYITATTTTTNASTATTFLYCYCSPTTTNVSTGAAPCFRHQADLCFEPIQSVGRLWAIPSSRAKAVNPRRPLFLARRTQRQQGWRGAPHVVVCGLRNACRRLLMT
eukprot:GHVT01101419.1.p1 GENE.GHVT01101419.1~~GHVT01101419.1.p1  ORF type:complete len:107 (+),score=13.91 GHVT01101419.1:1495-1815(+)